jgi:GNAT superfamily N-acetyltransferase
MVTMRDGGPADLEWLLGLFDEAVEWMVARGQSGQWGTEPFTGNPRRTAMVGGMVDSGGLRVAEHDGTPVGALVVGIAPLHVPPPDVPELYINLLLTSRRHAHQGIGSRLVAQARCEARDRQVTQLRVDCWAGAPSLVQWYCDQGFTPTGTFDVDGWPGQIFAMPLGDDEASDDGAAS